MEEVRQSIQQVLLKTSVFGGFEKKQVLGYIDQLREQNQTAMVELETRMEQMSAARSELAAQVGSFERSISELEEQLEERSGHISELTGVITGLKGELERQRQSQNETERELAGQREYNRQLALKANTSEYKAKRYDELSAQVGEVMIEAQRSATELLSSAEKKAAELQLDAIAATEQVSEEITSLRGDLDAIRQNIERAMRSFSERLDAIDGVIGKMEARRVAARPLCAQPHETLPGPTLTMSVEPLEQEGDTCEPEILIDASASGAIEEAEAPGTSEPIGFDPPLRSFFRRAAQA